MTKGRKEQQQETKTERKQASTQAFKRPRHTQKVGLVPGSLVYVGDTPSQTTKIHSIIYDTVTIEEVDSSIPDATEGRTLWVGISGLKDVDAIARLGQRFNISPLFLEDILYTDQRPKADRTEGYLFITLRLNHPEAPRMPEEQISLVMGKNFLISFQEQDSDVFDPVVKRLHNAESKLRKLGADVLLHALLDLIVDRYLVLADHLEDDTDEMEELVVNDPDSINASEIHRNKRNIQDLRRSTLPLRDIFSLLSGGSEPLISTTARVYFKDTYDHVLWLVEALDNLRETMQGLMEVYLSSLDTRMNHIMQVLTIISTVFIPLTFITSLYGMNFQYLPPETLKPWGFYGILGICVVLSVVMAWWFKRKKWW
ncbi:MAG: magnesium/cobalt transporter CorA [Sphaerochaetaceae bacterium]|jgi:magnesium transporter